MIERLTRRSRRRLQLAALVATCAGGLPAAIAGQECVSLTESGHDAWHARARAMAQFEDELAAILRDAGQAPLGALIVRQDDDGGFDAERRMLNVPAAAEDPFGEAVRRWLDTPELSRDAVEPPVAGGGESPYVSGVVAIEFGAPRPDLREDRTEVCEPELDNVAEAGGLFAQVVAGAIQREGKARPGGRVRIDFWALIDWTGRVTAIEFREDQGDWSWLVPYMEALAPALQYRPATLNGAARTVWAPQQFELEF